MSLDQSFIGREYPPSRPYEVGREKIREFATAIGDLNPLYFDRDAAIAAGYADVIAPPTFAIVVSMDISGQVIADPDLGLDYSKVVHGDQKFIHTRPIHAGDELVGVLHIDEIKSIAGNDVLTTRAELSTVDGEHVLTAITKLAARGTSAKEA
ncbi:acyl dehydratase [Antricoccus suffuscus]|uniref:UPF0336 protein CLV47_11988 n=1 Tax=Antricoccus suffuscus TaxID=1629062 RepID=A0A2T0ZS08_9ACTN|nr:MaoC family dehydratase N-terminal domain-containing protein [Antricoccus suffuscus]PRZ39139.1 acyl dehydratase [Antricoccus suffuscus]